MARPKQLNPSEKLVLSLPPQMKVYLDTLVPLGLYGKTPPEVAANLMSRAIEQLIKDQILHIRK